MAALTRPQRVARAIGVEVELQLVVFHAHLVFAGHSGSITGHLPSYKSTQHMAQSEEVQQLTVHSLNGECSAEADRIMLCKRTWTSLLASFSS